jgi:hypothetical protein
MRHRVTIRVHVDDELDKVIRRHSAAERIHKVATVGSPKMFEALESLAR